MARDARPKAAGWRLWLRRAGYVNLALAFLVVVLAGAAYLRLVAGPYSLSNYSSRVAKALAHRLGPGWRVQISDTALELNGTLPAVRAEGLEIRNGFGVLVVSAPYGLVSLDPISLVTGSISIREIELRDLKLKGTISQDGSIVFVPEQRPAETIPVVTGEPLDRSAVAVAVASLLDPIVRDTSVIGALDRATIVDASLTLIGPDGTERAAFGDVDGRFERLPDGSRHIDLALTGQHGTWTIEGRVGEGPDRTAHLSAARVPLADAMLLAGLRDLPVTSDLTLSADISAAFEEGRLRRLGVRFESSPGLVARASRPSVALDRAVGRGDWDEVARTLTLSEIEIASEGTTIKADGLLKATQSAGWQLDIRAHDVVVAGLSGSDASFRIDEAVAGLTFRDRIAILDQASLKGDAVDLRAAGSIETRGESPVIRGTLDIGRTDFRRLVRIWPDMLNPDLRAYLAGHAESGLVERARIGLDLVGPDVPAAFSDAPFTDKAISFDFAASNMTIRPADGMPALSGLAVEGTASGTRIDLRAPSGQVDLGEGRVLAFLDGTFRQEEVSRVDSVARIGFRIDGGLDAVAAFLKAPALKGVAGDLDPATIHGRAELKVALPIPPKRVPPIDSLPFSISGRLSDVAMDKLGGKEKLEAGNFLVGYDGGTFGLKGDAKIGGSPATIEVAGTRTGGIDANLGLTLDDAARSRRSLPSGPQLSGPVPIRIGTTFRGGVRGPVKVEADLSKAAIDGLIPGWTKPAGRPGRLAFSLGEGDAPELRDLLVDAGSVQVRGSAGLSASGSLERADLQTFKLSPGDDMRVQVDRSQGSLTRLTVRGNNGDIRPVLRWLTAATPKGGAPRESTDLDLDLGLNILSGHNDEAMTNVSARMSTRGGEPRSVAFLGRFRQAVLDVQLAKRDSGAPILSVKSGDAGATLRFLDVYRRMVGGRMAIEARASEGLQEGSLTIDEFGLRNEPALRRIAAQGTPMPQQGQDERGPAPIARSDLDQVLFNRLTGDFRRGGSRVDFHDVVIYGAQVGFTLGGMMDPGRDRMDVSGTFVPAYMLNNAFGQVPVVGILLGGGRNEGLFAVDFRVVGSISSPNVLVNPLTAVAPGILRKLFGWMLEGPAAPSPTAGNTVRPPAAQGER